MKPTPITNAHARQVEAMAAYGIPEKEIARVIGIDQAELRRLYPDELATGATKANSRVAENLYRRAIGENREAVAAAIFWLKARAGWKETSAHEVTGRDGGPIELPTIEPRRAAMVVLEMLRCAGYPSLRAFLERTPSLPGGAADAP